MTGEVDRTAGDSAVGLRVIIAYKIAKAILQGTLALALPVLVRLGVTAQLVAHIARFAEHLAHRWTAVLARHLAAWLTPNHLLLVGLALAFDAGMSTFEAWALHRRFRWAAWLVVLASSALVPFEIFELVRKLRVGRALILVVNLAIIAYLGRRARREHREHIARLRQGDSAGR